MCSSLQLVLDQTHTLNAYIYSFVTTHSRDHGVGLREIKHVYVWLNVLGAHFVALIVVLDVDDFIRESPSQLVASSLQVTGHIA